MEVMKDVSSQEHGLSALWLVGIDAGGALFGDFVITWIVGASRLLDVQPGHLLEIISRIGNFPRRLLHARNLPVNSLAFTVILGSKRDRAWIRSFQFGCLTIAIRVTAREQARQRK